mmetsp:Transcript_6259/g.9460  ORF Transcript_6259/g.9460 Transcript_6259/m.9460 type:complete len:210 (-) Transcript_6259:175-804(-)
MKLLQLVVLITSCMTSVSAFAGNGPTQASKTSSNTSTSSTALQMASSNNNRRSFFATTASAVFGTIAINTILPQPANAIPGIAVEEFETILKSAAKSVKIVELSGPKQETAVVTLIDGTQFLITDLYESPTDPRSPLKLISTCRSYKVPTKSVGLEAALLNLSSSGAKKKKVYMNKRVQMAAELEREKKERMDQDEVDRLQAVEDYKRM